MRHRLCLVVAVLCFAAALSAQRRVDARYSYHRVIAVVPLVGSGTAADPIRGKHVPTAQLTGQPEAGIIAFAVELTDNGKSAIVELVALRRTALAQVLADRSAGVLVFEKGVVSDASIEAAIRPFRKDFSLLSFGVVAQ